METLDSSITQEANISLTKEKLDEGWTAIITLKGADKRLDVCIGPYDQRGNHISEGGYRFTTISLLSLNTIGYEIDRIPGMTTALYKRAHQIMQEVVLIARQPLFYRFQTRNIKMTDWACDPEKGFGIFDWDYAVVEANEKGPYFKAEKLFLPPDI